MISLPSLIDRHRFIVLRKTDDGELSFGPFAGWFQSVRSMARPFYLTPIDADVILYVRGEVIGDFEIQPLDTIKRLDTGEMFTVNGVPEDPSGERWLFEIPLKKIRLQ